MTYFIRLNGVTFEHAEDSHGFIRFVPVQDDTEDDENPCIILSVN